MKPGFLSFLQEIRRCDLCSDRLPLGPRPVLQSSLKARILIAGQAPGRKVHETGVPFDDPSGDRLRDWMGIGKEVFYDASKVAIIPMGFCYPGPGKSGDQPPIPECAETWREKLLERLNEIVLILTIGKYAHQYHLGASQKKTLTKTVKSWGQYLPEGILPLPHPSPRNNIWLKKNPWFAKEVLPVLKLRVEEILGR